MTTKQEISGWFNRGVSEGADFLIVVCDTYDHEDYPVYASVTDYQTSYDSHRTNMQRVMEVYDLSMDKDTQLNERRAFNPPKK
ncbi:MAG: hypothetical protein V3T23_04685 [Nitrososphaerales archaeon]